MRGTGRSDSRTTTVPGDAELNRLSALRVQLVGKRIRNLRSEPFYHFACAAVISSFSFCMSAGVSVADSEPGLL